MAASPCGDLAWNGRIFDCAQLINADPFNTGLEDQEDAGDYFDASVAFRDALSKQTRLPF